MKRNLSKDNIPENTSKNTHNVVFELLFEDKDTNIVMDIPSGAGAFTKRLLDANKEVHSADIQNILQVDNPNFQVSDMNKTLPFEDGKFCAVVCIDGIEHIERQYDFIRECHRVLRKGGKLILSTPNISSIRSRWRWLTTGHHNKCKAPLNEVKPTPLHHIGMISFHEMRYLLHSNGFTITSIRTNRIKLVSWLYALWMPLLYISTSLVYKKEEKDPDQRKRNKEIKKQMFSSPILFGETMIIKATKH
ncbi:class I SAM-dependent methyltransferase [Fulvivirgaceae bacterium BMA10]|uniref:Class I SAM-dependent methyltransferase n=1 Tax=Splendidivirga corallicola TaxID=3051826 RepID=A0ABT8KID1_9BACT|nr:class I SAM-dependent methyltransferase [Fulvivirgaceae bacterium BMA10]